MRRRYDAALDVLLAPGMAIATALAVLVVALALAARGRVLAPAGGDRATAAVFAGALTAGIVGALVEDSGPLLFVEAVCVLACVTGYLHARPPARVGADRRDLRVPLEGPQVRAAASGVAVTATATATPTIAVLGGTEGTA
jgi:hypothetical protein